MPTTPTRLFWKNLAAVGGVLVANWAWLTYFSAVLSAISEWWGVGAFGVIALLAYFVRKEWLERMQSGVIWKLLTRSLYPYLLAVLAVELAASLFFAAIVIEDTSGVGGTLNVAIHRLHQPATAGETWDAKKPYRDGFWLARPDGDAKLVVAVKGVPAKEHNVAPWFYFDGRHKLEYPKDFLRPVVLATAERQMVLDAVKFAQAKPPRFQLVVKVNGAERGRVTYSGRSVWIGCRVADDIAIVEKDVAIDFPNPAADEFKNTVLNPQDDNALAEPLQKGDTVALEIWDTAMAQTRAALPASIALAEPTKLADLFRAAVIKLPIPK